MLKHLKYFKRLLMHKWFVFVAGIRLRVPLWQLIIHDWSKFTPKEWTPYVDRFMSGGAGKEDKAADPDAFHRAWTHHWHVNPHHWEHWLVFTDSGAMRALEMPERYVREMAADWLGASRVYSGSWDITNWYRANQGRIRLHAETRARVEELLGLA